MKKDDTNNLGAENLIPRNPPNSTLQKWKLGKLSPNKINLWKRNKALFYLNYIEEYRGNTNDKMVRGQAVEAGIHSAFLGHSMETSINNALQYYDEALKDFKGDKEKTRDKIPLMIEYGFEELSEFKLISFQQKVECEIAGAEFMGYTDFIMDVNGETHIIDLKTTGKKPYQFYTHELQQSIYSHALGYPATLFYIIATQRINQFIHIVTDDMVKTCLKDIELTVQSLTRVLEMCTNEDDFKSVCMPNLEDFEWNDEELISVRKKVFGV